MMWKENINKMSTKRHKFNFIIWCVFNCLKCVVGGGSWLLAIQYMHNMRRPWNEIVPPLIDIYWHSARKSHKMRNARYKYLFMLTIQRKKNTNGTRIASFTVARLIYSHSIARYFLLCWITLNQYQIKWYHSTILRIIQSKKTTEKLNSPAIFHSSIRFKQKEVWTKNIYREFCHQRNLFILSFPSLSPLQKVSFFPKA